MPKFFLKDRIATSISISAATSANLSSAHEPLSTSPPLLFVIDDELTKIAASCITPLEHEQLSGNLIRHLHARCFNHHLITEAADIIASTEMRAALGFAPPGPWTNYRKPSADKLTSALTMEEYFDLRERSKDRSLFLKKIFLPLSRSWTSAFLLFALFLNVNFKKFFRST